MQTLDIGSLVYVTLPDIADTGRVIGTVRRGSLDMTETTIFIVRLHNSNRTVRALRAEVRPWTPCDNNVVEVDFRPRTPINATGWVC